MKEFITDNALRLFVGGLFVVAIAISVLLHNYANRVQQSLINEKPPGRVVSDTLRGDYDANEVTLGN